MNLDEVNKIREQFSSGLWPQFLEMIQITGLRGWKGQSIEFLFPVTAICGENGTGKSTALKVAASAYAPSNGTGYYPSDFFPTTYWDTISGVNLAYRIKTGSDKPTYTSNKPSARWSYSQKQKSRKVFWFDVGRTLPLDATAGYAKVAKQAAGETQSVDLDDEYRMQLSAILGREYHSARFASPDVDKNRQVGVLGRDFGEISQFHQGAGEDTTLDLLRALQDVPKYSLIVIDEVEASLHPRAQRRLVRYLIHQSRINRLQVILSTHSPYVLEELPAEARVLLLPSPDGPTIIPGASAEFSLSSIDDIVHPEVFIYTEDSEASILLREILASHSSGSDILSRLYIRPIGPANVVKLMGDLAVKRKLPHRAVGVLDGDADNAPGCIKLPGSKSPERVVFEGLRDKQWPNVVNRFGIGAGTLFQYLEDVMLTNDCHTWTAQVGNRVLKSAAGVWEILCAEWCKSCLSEADRDRMFEAINGSLE